MTSAYAPDPPAAMPWRAVVALMALVLGLAWFAIAVVPELETLLPMAPEQRAVADVVERMVVAGQETLVPPERDASGHVSPAVLASMRSHVSELAAELCAEPFRTRWSQQMIAAIDGAGTANSAIAGGATSFHRWHIEIDGDRARVTVRARVFLESGPLDGYPGERPEGEADYQLELRLIGGRWLVTSLAFGYPPGWAP